MKKITIWLLICLIIFSLCACGSENSEDTQINSPETTLTEESNSLSSSEAAYIYNKAYSLAATWFDFYNEYWNQEDSFVETNGYEYFAINHETINSVATLKDYLCEFFSENLVDSVIGEAYLDREGKLYQRCYSVGDHLPTYYLNFTKADFTSEDEEKTTYNITVTYRYDEDLLGDGNPEKNETVNISYVQENGNWVIDNHFRCTLYAPYEWDGKSVATDEDASNEENFDNSTGKIVTETSDNVMMAFYNEEAEEFSEKLFSNWASSTTIVEFEKSYPSDLVLTNDISDVKLDSSYALDISESGDGSVVAYLTTDKTDIILHIAGKDGVVMANENSYGVFWYNWAETSEFAKSLIKEIRFNDCFNTSKATTMKQMFNTCKALTKLDLSGFDTSNVTDMSSMFDGCKNLTDLNLSNFNTEKVTSMLSMFEGCKSLNNLNLSSFNTEKLTNMYAMFSECESLTALNLSKFITSNVTTMYALFNECKSLVFLDISNFDTSKVTDMGFMFAYCEAITSLDLSNFCTSNVTTMKTMFYNCRSLTSIDVSSFDTSNVINFSNMFNSCAALTTLDVSNFDTSKCDNISLGSRRSVFEGCYDTEIIYNGQVYKYGQIPDLYKLEDDFFNVED